MLYYAREDIMPYKRPMTKREDARGLQEMRGDAKEVQVVAGVEVEM